MVLIADSKERNPESGVSEVARSQVLGSLRSPVEIVVVFGGEISWQVILNSVLCEPLQRMPAIDFSGPIVPIDAFNVDDESPVARQIHRAFRHDHHAIEMCIERDHENFAPEKIIPEMSGFG
jgi:hypothetical protein